LLAPRPSGSPALGRSGLVQARSERPESGLPHPERARASGERHRRLRPDEPVRAPVSILTLTLFRADLGPRLPPSSKVWTRSVPVCFRQYLLHNLHARRAPPFRHPDRVPGRHPRPGARCALPPQRLGHVHARQRLPHPRPPLRLWPQAGARPAREARAPQPGGRNLATLSRRLCSGEWPRQPLRQPPYVLIGLLALSSAR
jgi:hypothetical protein